MKWSDHDKAKLRRLHREGVPLKVIARELGRDYRAVKSKAWSMRLGRKRSRGKKFRATFTLPEALAQRLEAQIKSGVPIGRVVRQVLSERLGA